MNELPPWLDDGPEHGDDDAPPLAYADGYEREREEGAHVTTARAAHSRGPFRDRVEIQIDGDLSRVVDASIEALAPHDVYQRGGMLADVVHDAPPKDDGLVRPDGAPRIRILPRMRLREMLSIAVDYSKRTVRKDGGEGRVSWRSVPPPAEVVATVEARGEWRHLRPLVAIAEWPCLRPDGTILCEAGYDRATGLLCESATAVDVPTLPTLGDAKAAAATLLDLVSDFPFTGDAHRSAWLVTLLTLLARPAIDGPTPLLLIDKNTRGAGGTLLADAIGAILRGSALPRRTQPKSPEEWGKVMLGIALAGDPLVLIDNIVSTLRSDDLDTVLTGTTYTQRVLGVNENRTLPWRTVLVATANNAAISGDLVRRSILCRLEAQQERPEERTGFRYPNLIDHIKRNRAQYLAAGLTILRAYEAAGRPAVTLRPMGSYEAWSIRVRAPLVWAEQADPAESQDLLREAGDPEREELEALLRAWYDRFGERRYTVRAAMTELGTRLASDIPLLDAMGSACGEQPGKPDFARKLGARLRAAKGCVIAGLRLNCGAKVGDGIPWFTEQVSP